MAEIKVALGERSYSVCLDEGGTLIEMLMARFAGRRFALVTNTTLHRLYAERIGQWAADLDAAVHVIPDGEQYKTLDTWREILDALFEARLDRGAVVLAFGGGVVGDIAGFAAAAFMRGIDYVQIPTTLLAMVDSSVGGKTAVNHHLGKNLIGAFHQPRLVWIETRFLDGLPDRQYLAGYAEVFKNAFIGGPEMFEFIDRDHDALTAKEPTVLKEAVLRSVRIKAGIVAEDERESGKRALLNFGHTFGHALEKYYNYVGILHGEAVHWGIACALDLALRLGMIPSESRQRYDSLHQKVLKPQLPSRPNPEELYRLMFSDKKVLGGTLRLVLPTAPGVSVVRDDVPEEAVKATLNDIFGAKA